MSKLARPALNQHSALPPLHFKENARHETMAGQTDGIQLKESAAAQLATARAAYVKEAGRGRAGTETARRYADQMDGVVQAVVEAACGCTDLPVAVCAVGGYGRRAL